MTDEWMDGRADRRTTGFKGFKFISMIYNCRRFSIFSNTKFFLHGITCSEFLHLKVYCTLTKPSQTADIIIQHLLNGSIVSDCSLPRSTTKTDTQYRSERVSRDNKIEIQFTLYVKVTTTFPLRSFFSSVGGLMGLWLVQTIDTVCSLPDRCAVCNTGAQHQLAQ